MEWIVADLKRMLQTASIDPAPLHAALARAYQHLGRHEKTLQDEHPPSVIQSASNEPMAVLDQVAMRRLKAAVAKALAFGHALFDASCTHFAVGSAPRRSWAARCTPDPQGHPRGPPP
ncbi:Hypothetical protein CAP_1133 [Chondromyces apiculatus DSM 436]|uniref:Uncharacterized protein n=1 Tax=Chondromyces apiculatus DSM 436 TaxID=1192034 RepID=A0A017SV32_9BACT|nr:Hypothetical protein CAP_1133 [Chondromyces apiculatus DSM 436]